MGYSIDLNTMYITSLLHKYTILGKTIAYVESIVLDLKNII